MNNVKLDYQDIAGIVENILDDAYENGLEPQSIQDLYDYLEEHSDQYIEIEGCE